VLFLLAQAALIASDATDWINKLGGRVERDQAGNVVAVNLRGSWINDMEMIGLARLNHLERLDLSHTRITDEGMLYLKSAPRIADLNLYYAELVTDQGLSAIKGWKYLKRLNVRGTRISDGTLEMVSRLTGLQALDIANTQITDNGLEHLITLVNLRELALGRGRLSDSAAEVVRMLPTLIYLDLSGARPVPPDTPRARSAGGAIPESTLRAIAELKDLRTLKLGYSNITAEGLRILGALENVEKLGLEACSRVDDQAVAELSNWKSLKYVDLQETRVTGKGLDALRKEKPGLVVLSSPPKVPGS
jgi:Leucine-rich repeat (LRR) protein